MVAPGDGDHRGIEALDGLLERSLVPVSQALDVGCFVGGDVTADGRSGHRREATKQQGRIAAELLGVLASPAGSDPRRLVWLFRIDRRPGSVS